MADYDTDRYFAREAEILNSIHHPYIVRFMGTSKDGTDLCLVAEFVKASYFFFDFLSFLSSMTPCLSSSFLFFSFHVRAAI